MLAVVGASLGGIVLFKEVHHASQMPVVNVEFGDRPTIEFPSETAPAGLKVVELLEAMARWFAAATPSPLTITVWSGARTPRSTPASTVTSRPASASVSARSSRLGPDRSGAQRRFPLGGIHSAGVRLWFPWRSAGRIGGEDTLVFVIDIISTR